jgi:hypothetical protein
MTVEMTGLTNSKTETFFERLALATISEPMVVGAFLGLAWGASLRAWMALLALEFGERPHLTWKGAFGGVLLPAALMGALLGSAANAAEPSSRKRWRWAILSPILLVLGAALFTENFIPTLISTGMGGGAIGVALIALIGGGAFSGFGTSWLRWVCGLLILFVTLAAAYGLFRATVIAPSASQTFVILFFVLLMALLIAGVCAPFRIWPSPNGSPKPGAPKVRKLSETKP